MRNLEHHPGHFPNRQRPLRPAGLLRTADRRAYPDLAGMGDMMSERANWGNQVLNAALAITIAGLASACTEEATDVTAPRDAALPLQQPIAIAEVPAPLPGAHCDIPVDGVGTLDIEGDYLPHVIQCENGGANLEALKAQAIAARSVAYYAIETSGSICDSQGCQVYGCGSDPLPIHYQAVDETSGQYLMYNGTLTYGFYVAGDSDTAAPACVGVSGSTEGWVTYNEAQSGTDVEQTELGFVHDPGDNGYGQNRGCMSQWGARCLENDNGYDDSDILQFYYGADIVVAQAEGACVRPPAGDDTGGGDDGPVDPPATTGVGDSSGGAAGDDTGGGDDGPSLDGTEGDPTPDETTDDAADDPAEGTSGAGGTAGDPPALPTTYGADDEGGACACRAPSSRRSTTIWWSLIALGLLGRRRARAPKRGKTRASV